MNLDSPPGATPASAACSAATAANSGFSPLAINSRSRASLRASNRSIAGIAPESLSLFA